jgi:hypothetical protein
MEKAREGEIHTIQRKLEEHVLPGAWSLYITGSGDPFGSPYFREFLQGLRREDIPRLHRLHLHTNAQLWTPRTWERIDPAVRQVIGSTEISIDAATPETYAKNRSPGQFARLLDNLAFISELRRDGPLHFLAISMVVQENNFREMPAFVELGRSIGADKVYFSQLVNWRTFSTEEFERRAVHRPSHPAHGELVRQLGSPLYNHPAVFLGNLSNLRVRQDDTPES